LLNLRPAPEFEAWLETVGIADAQGLLRTPEPKHPLLQVLP